MTAETRAYKRGQEAAADKSTWSTVNPYAAAKQRGEWAAGREAGEKTDDFQAVLRRAEDRIAHASHSPELALAMLVVAFPRHVRECEVTEASLRRCSAPAFDLLTYGRDHDYVCAWCSVDWRMSTCSCRSFPTTEQRFACDWAKRHACVGPVVLREAGLL